MDIGICALCKWCSDQFYKEQQGKPCRKGTYQKHVLEHEENASAHIIINK